MVMAAGAKRNVATRLSRETLAQMAALVQSGRFKNRTAAIEAAVGLLYHAEQHDVERRRRAFARSCGALSIGIGVDARRRAELERLESEAGGC